MAHVAHLLIPGPWGDTETLEPSGEQLHHLSRVLRLSAGDPVSYTDGKGSLGLGSLVGSAVARGEESTVSRPIPIVIAVAPPDNRDRARFAVEKLSELGVSRLRWLATRRGEGRIPAAEKARSWAVAALEQSHGAWLMEVDDELATWSSLERPLTVATPGGEATPHESRTVAIGPEGGWDEGEVPADASLLDLGPTILRVETAAIVAATRFERPWQAE